MGSAQKPSEVSVYQHFHYLTTSDQPELFIGQLLKEPL